MAPWLPSIFSAYEPVVKSLSVSLFFVGELALGGCVVMTLLPPSLRYRVSLPELILPGLFVAVAFAETWSLFDGVTPWANVVLILLLFTGDISSAVVHCFHQNSDASISIWAIGARWLVSWALAANRQPPTANCEP